MLDRTQVAILYWGQLAVYLKCFNFWPFLKLLSLIFSEIKNVFLIQGQILPILSNLKVNYIKSTIILDVPKKRYIKLSFCTKNYVTELDEKLKY